MFCRRGSLDAFEVFVNGNKKVDTIVYGGLDSSKIVDIMDIYLFVQARDGLENELFYTNNSINWLPGPTGTWYNYDVSNTQSIMGSGHIKAHSDLRLNNKLDWDTDFLFNYGDHEYSITMEDYSSYDHKERFVTYGYGRYGGNLNSW